MHHSRRPAGRCPFCRGCHPGPSPSAMNVVFWIIWARAHVAADLVRVGVVVWLQRVQVAALHHARRGAVVTPTSHSITGAWVDVKLRAKPTVRVWVRGSSKFAPLETWNATRRPFNSTGRSLNSTGGQNVGKSELLSASGRKTGSLSGTPTSGGKGMLLPRIIRTAHRYGLWCKTK